MKPVLLLAYALVIGSLTASCKKSGEIPPSAQLSNASRVWDALENTTIPEFKMQGETDEAALRFVIRKIAQKHPGFEYVIHQSPTPGCPIYVHLKNVPAYEALRYICSVGNREYVIASGVLVVSASGVPLKLPLETQTFHVGMGDPFFHGCSKKMSRWRMSKKPSGPWESKFRLTAAPCMSDPRRNWYCMRITASSRPCKRCSILCPSPFATSHQPDLTASTPPPPPANFLTHISLIFSATGQARFGPNRWAQGQDPLTIN